MKNAQINVPWLVRIKPAHCSVRAWYLARSCLAPVALFHGEDLLQPILDMA